MFLMRIQPGHEAEFEEAWKNQVDTLKSQKGFRSRELIRIVQGAGSFVALALVFSDLGMPWTASLIALGAVIATTSALVPYQAAQPRIFFSMARDGLLPSWAARVHPRFRTPHVTTILTGIFVAICSSIANIGELVELTNIGTLFAFVLVGAGILVLRRTDPHRPRPFRTPLVPWVPLGAIACCSYLMCELPWLTWLRFFGWMGVGLVLYFLYGSRRSRVGRRDA
jgi:APA family basic amino acid/polyamine antiporter